MDKIRFGRRHLTFRHGAVKLTSTSRTERAYPGEDEHAFTNRLIDTYGDREGTIEIIFKSGRPEYAIVTIKATD